MIGSVDNGFNAEVKVSNFDGTAAVRLRGETAQIALMTKPGFMASFPRKITATGARKVPEVKGMLILTVDWVPAA